MFESVVSELHFVTLMLYRLDQIRRGRILTTGSNLRGSVYHLHVHESRLLQTKVCSYRYAYRAEVRLSYVPHLLLFGKESHETPLFHILGVFNHLLFHDSSRRLIHDTDFFPFHVRFRVHVSMFIHGCLFHQFLATLLARYNRLMLLLLLFFFFSIVVFMD